MIHLFTLYFVPWQQPLSRLSSGRRSSIVWQRRKLTSLGLDQNEDMFEQVNLSAASVRILSANLKNSMYYNNIKPSEKRIHSRCTYVYHILAFLNFYSI